jgi:hypothetical protein
MAGYIALTATATVPPTGHSKRSPPPTYDGICAEKNIEWELAIDNVFSQCCICEWRKNSECH